MTVSAATIALVSPFTVGASGTFTEEAFTSYKTWAQKRLDRDNPGFDSDTYDYCHALLICDLYENSRGGLGLKSESIGGGDYSYTKGGDGETKTSYMIQYEQILKSFGHAEPCHGVERTDKDGGAQFKLDQQGIAKFHEDDTTITENELERGEFDL